MTDIRNIAIIAHVDHGKTTLVDAMLAQSGAFRENQHVDERVMDNNDLEKERGITILAKCASVFWHNTKINIIDTPGHADFGGEVERVLSMANGVVLLVDAAEGPMPQTKFVLSKALRLGLKPIVIINKIDRPDERAEQVIDEVFDLFVSLDAKDDQLDFPVLYASGREGWCVTNLDDERTNLKPLFDLVMQHVPAPQVNKDGKFSMLASILQPDPFLGRLLIGLVYSGKATVNAPVKAMNLEGEVVEMGRLTKLQGFAGVNRVPLETAHAGDIIVVAGLAEGTVSDTICDPVVETPIQSTPIDPPTMAITVSVNDSPLAGLEGTKVTSRMIRDRLFSEAETNVALSVKEAEGRKDAFEVGGRGELQLGVLIETMRREGFELSISRPHVLLKKDEKTGAVLEPIEEVVIDVDEDYSGAVVEGMSLRKADLQDMRPSGGGKTRMVFLAPSRGLVGYQSEFMNETRGTGVLNRLFYGYAPYKGEIDGKRNGALISNGHGDVVAYALFNLQDRGVMFVKPQDKTYQGMVVGEHNRENDLEVNVLKGKQLTNVRASGKDESIRLNPPRVMTLETMISLVGDDELIEVTPNSLRLRKKLLDPNDRKKESRKKVK